MTKVTVVGSVNLDLVVAAPHLPVPGETVLGSDVVFRPGGKGANQAVAARRMGAAVTLFGACGADVFATDVMAALHREEVDLTRVAAVPATPTGMALIVVRPDGQNTVTVAPGANNHFDASKLDSLAAELVTSDALLMQMEIPPETNLAAARIARRADVPVVLNAAPLPPAPRSKLDDLLGLVDVLVVNQTEAAQLGGKLPPEDASTWFDIASDLRKLGPAVVVITLGDQGAVAVADADAVHQAAFAVNAVDGTGAGDACCGAFAVALAEGRRLPEALRRSCAAGALATTRIGAQAALPTEDEVATLLGRPRKGG